MPKRRADFDVTLCGYFGFGNLGDELLASSAIEHLCDAGVARDRIALLSNSPSESEKKFGVASYDRWGLQTVKSVLNRSNTLLLSGGGLFQDATSVKSCVYYWGLVRLAALSSCRVWALGQSVGPLDTRLGFFFARDALGKAAYLAVRDEPSLKIAESMRMRAVSMPDLAMGLRAPRVEVDRAGPVLVNIRPSAKNAGAVESVVDTAKILMRGGVHVRGLAMSPEDRDEFARRFEHGGSPPEIKTPETLEEFAEWANGCSCALGMRLHFAVISTLLGLQATVSPYDPKVASFAASFGLGFADAVKGGDSSDIMYKLTNVPIQDKRKIENSRDSVSFFVREGLKRVMEDGWINA